MGTNFYRREKIGEEEKNLWKKAIDSDDYPTIDYYSSLSKKIHIGKASAGWKFLWDANYFNYFEPNKESILEWLKDGIIIDEYGEIYSYERFMEYLEQRNVPFNQYDASTYEHYCTMEGLPKGNYPRDNRFNTWFTSRYGLNVDLYGEFYIDDMRFTVDSNFS